jgi:pimeloyl-ACP methyl ester carboxylesterase
VLLCYPLGKEYLRSHWACRQVASQLVRAGFHVFRFDYCGTGDSAGDSGDGDVLSWREDIAAAAQELRDTAGTKRLALVGLRFGATLAAMSSAELHPRDLVLWDPVVNGKRYLERLKTLHRQLVGSPTYFASPRHDSGEDEMLGFLYPPRMAQTIAAADLLETSLRAERVHLIVTEERLKYRLLRRRLTATSEYELTYHEVPAHGQWNDLDQIEHALMVGTIPQTICDALQQPG